MFGRQCSVAGGQIYYCNHIFEVLSFLSTHMGPPEVTTASPEIAAYVGPSASYRQMPLRAKSAKSAALLQSLIEYHSLTGCVDERQAGLVAALAVQGANIGEDERGYVVNAIRVIDGRLESTDQLNGASPPALLGISAISNILRAITLQRRSTSKRVHFQYVTPSLITSAEPVSPAPPRSRAAALAQPRRSRDPHCAATTQDSPSPPRRSPMRSPNMSDLPPSSGGRAWAQLSWHRRIHPSCAG